MFGDSGKFARSDINAYFAQEAKQVDQPRKQVKIDSYGDSSKVARSDISAYFAQQATRAEQPRVARKPIATPTKAQKLWMFNMGYEHHEQKPLYFGAHVRPPPPPTTSPSLPPTLEVTQGQILSLSPTDATSSR